MTTQEFVQAIELVVVESSFDVMKAYLTDQDLVKKWPKYRSLNEWFNNQPLEDQEKINTLMQDSIRIAIDGFFLVLDGSRVIEDTYDKGDLFLIYKNKDEETWLNDPDYYIRDYFRGIRDVEENP